MTIRQWAARATSALTKSGIESARLDATLLLGDELGRGKSWLIAHDQETLAPDQLARLNAKLKRRQQRAPMAYIRGWQEFYGRPFKVTPDVLIPRPETEDVIELFKTIRPKPGSIVADIGTGSGAIAITAKLECPDCQVIATDISADAVNIAQLNARQLGAEVDFRQGDLFGPLTEKANIIIANLPYVDASWQRSPETDYEPPTALFADQNGLKIINTFLGQAPGHLRVNGHVIIEADPEQHPSIKRTAQGAGLSYKLAQNYSLLLG